LTALPKKQAVRPGGRKGSIISAAEQFSTAVPPDSVDGLTSCHPGAQQQRSLAARHVAPALDSPVRLRTGRFPCPAHVLCRRIRVRRTGRENTRLQARDRMLEHRRRASWASTGSPPASPRQRSLRRGNCLTAGTSRARALPHRAGWRETRRLGQVLRALQDEAIEEAVRCHPGARRARGGQPEPSAEPDGIPAPRWRSARGRYLRSDLRQPGNITGQTSMG